MPTASSAKRPWSRSPSTHVLIGREVLVTEQIENLKETGEIKVNGVLWTAKCTTGERVEAGGHVTIERVEGAKLYVRPAKCPCTKA